MNAEIKKQWLEALRSDKYEQIANALYGGRNGTVKCCALGVLNDISGLGKWREHDGYVVFAQDQFDYRGWEEFVLERIDWGDDEFKQFVHKDGRTRTGLRVSPPDFEAEYHTEVAAAIEACYFMEDEMLHEKVATFAGLSRSPKVKVPDGDGTLVEWDVFDLNDNGYSFEKIADLIEEQL